MGNDTPLAVLSDQPQLLFNYFKQLFAQVTNPPIDADPRELVMSLGDDHRPERNLFDETPEHCHQLRIETPILTNEELARIREIDAAAAPTTLADALPRRRRAAAVCARAWTSCASQAPARRSRTGDDPHPVRPRRRRRAGARSRACSPPARCTIT
jgi:hypothetical protein